MWTYKCDRCGAALDPGERCDCQDRPAKYNGKPIFTQENFNYSEAKIGDYVEQAVVDDAMDCLPPASMSARCAQMGEPYSHREDPETGRLRPTYYTFKRVAGEWPNGIWQFCGCCFQGETVPPWQGPDLLLRGGRNDEAKLRGGGYYVQASDPHDPVSGGTERSRAALPACGVVRQTSGPPGG